MPRRDGTGPLGLGSMTGRGLGVCSEVNHAPVYGRGLGLSCGRCFGRSLGRGQGPGFSRGWGFGSKIYNNQLSSKEMLLAQREQIKNVLDAIEKQLESL